MENQQLKHPPLIPSNITQLGDDLLLNILHKLPAKSFGSAASVNRSWNTICTRILSRPKLSSALSINPSLPDAINEVVGKVFSEPIRPQFAILCLCPNIGLDEAHRLITKELGSAIPIITSRSAGVIGRDAVTDQFREINFPCCDEGGFFESSDGGGISLTVGYMPGLKIDAIPLRKEKEHGIAEFVMDIRDYTDSVSHCPSPEAIILFGDLEADMKPVLDKLDYVFPRQTIIAGNESCTFRCGSIDQSVTTSSFQGCYCSSYKALALVFARDKNHWAGSGKIEFHFSVGTGLNSVGPTYKVVCAKRRIKTFETWITAKRPGENGTLDGNQLLADVDIELLEPDLYIGVTKKRKCSVGSEKVKPVTSVVYHPVQQADEEYLYVSGGDIKTGDPFHFCVPDPDVALSSCLRVSQKFRDLNPNQIIGGFLFACSGRGSVFFDKPNVDSSPILDNFPHASLGGMFCGGEIGRVPSIDESQDQDSKLTMSHVYSSVYLLISYSPPCTL